MKLFALIFSLLLGFQAHAQNISQDEEEGLDYDALVRKLSRAQDRDTTVSSDPFENVKIHTGVGFTNSIFTVNHYNGDKTYGAQRGIQVSLGIDLFSRNWQAEGTFRNFGESRYENSNVGLKEFDLKLIYQSRFAPAWAFRVGGGIAARYMDVNYFGSNGSYSKQFQTPASFVQSGLLTYLTTGLSVGADASLRTAAIEETPDRSSFDFTLRLDGHF